MAKRRRFKHEGRGAVTLLRIVAHANYGKYPVTRW